MAGARQQDPMVSLFIEEVTELLDSFEEQISKLENGAAFEKDAIDELFRIVHTVKADATMMLVESMAISARALERILYFYRDGNGYTIEHKDEFSYLLHETLDFFCEELTKAGDTDKLYDEKKGIMLGKKCDVFLEKLKNKKGPNQNGYKEPKSEEPFRFYIASKVVGSDNNNDMAKKAIIQKAEAAGSTFKKSTKAATVTSDDIKRLADILDDADALNTNISKSDADVDIKMRIRELTNNLHGWIKGIYMSELSHITIKLNAVVKEMNERLGKNVKIIIKGDDTIIEKVNLEKISSFLIHLLRNSIDHGIESSDVRRRLNKDEDGCIYIKYSTSKDGKGVYINYSDDGCGLDADKILITAYNKGLISGDANVPEEKDIFNLIMLPGYTTSVSVSEYSGRGVGMDVVKHNITEMGGTIDISSQINEGTNFDIYIPYIIALPKNGKDT